MMDKFICLFILLSGYLVPFLINMPRRGNIRYYYTYVVFMERGFSENGRICSFEMSICRNNKFKEFVTCRSPIEPVTILCYMITVKCCWRRLEIVPDSVVLENEQSVPADLLDFTQMIVFLVTSKHNGGRVLKDWMINVAYPVMFPNLIRINQDE